MGDSCNPLPPSPRGFYAMGGSRGSVVLKHVNMHLRERPELRRREKPNLINRNPPLPRCFQVCHHRWSSDGQRCARSWKPNSVLRGARRGACRCVAAERSRSRCGKSRRQCPEVGGVSRAPPGPSPSPSASADTGRTPSWCSMTRVFAVEVCWTNRPPRAADRAPLVCLCGW